MPQHSAGTYWTSQATATAIHVSFEQTSTKSNLAAEQSTNMNPFRRCQYTTCNYSQRTHDERQMETQKKNETAKPPAKHCWRGAFGILSSHSILVFTVHTQHSHLSTFMEDFFSCFCISPLQRINVEQHSNGNLTVHIPIDLNFIIKWGYRRCMCCSASICPPHAGSRPTMAFRWGVIFSPTVQVDDGATWMRNRTRRHTTYAQCVLSKTTELMLFSATSGKLINTVFVINFYLSFSRIFVGSISQRAFSPLSISGVCMCWIRFLSSVNGFADCFRQIIQ